MYRSVASMKTRQPVGQNRARARVAALQRPQNVPSYFLLLPLLIVALLLAGCAQPGAKVAKAPKAEKKIVAAIGPAEKVKGVAAAEQADEQAAEKTTATASAASWTSADKLVGLGSEDVRATLGNPARIRDEDPARIYQYVGGDCVLDLFLYQADGTEGAYRVTYAEARSAKAEKKPVDVCLKSLPSPLVAANTPTS